MSECHVINERMPLLLTESLDTASREATHQHIEACAACREEWAAARETWDILAQLPEVEVPPRVRERFLAELQGPAQPARVVPFQQRREVRWLAQAAAVAVIAGGSYFAGHRGAPVQIAQSPAVVSAVQPVPASFSLAEKHVLRARTLSPNIEGRPNIENVEVVDANATDGEIGVSFDVTSHVTVKGSPADKSMVRLLSYVLQSDAGQSPSRSQAIELVRRTYGQSHNTDPEIAQALAKVLRDEEHEGVRINAADTLKTLSSSSSNDATRSALIEALRSDPNPAVRIKAVEALAKLAGKGAVFDSPTIETLRQKASQDTENMYVRVKAAEALSMIRPQ